MVDFANFRDGGAKSMLEPFINSEQAPYKKVTTTERDGKYADKTENRTT